MLYMTVLVLKELEMSVKSFVTTVKQMISKGEIYFFDIHLQIYMKLHLSTV
jgi:hypothetical protein